MVRKLCNYRIFVFNSSPTLCYTLRALLLKFGTASSGSCLEMHPFCVPPTLSGFRVYIYLKDFAQTYFQEEMVRVHILSMFGNCSFLAMKYILLRNKIRNISCTGLMMKPLSFMYHQCRNAAYQNLNFFRHPQWHRNTAKWGDKYSEVFPRSLEK